MSEGLSTEIVRQALPRRIEVEDLLPGDTFEYEHREWGYLYAGPGRYENPVRDEEGRWQKGLKSTVLRDTVRQQPGLREVRNGITSSVQPNKTWWDHEDEESVRRPMTYVSTVTGSNNHGYVALRPRTVVVLLARTQRDYSPGMPGGDA